MATEKRPGYWQACQTVNGKRHWGYGKTAEDAEDDALRKAGLKTSREILGHHKDGSVADHFKRNILPLWAQLAPTTQARYLDEWERHIEPTFGRRLIRTVTSRDVRDWLNAHPGSQYGKRYSRAVLFGIFQEAYMTEEILSNPVARVKPPRVVKESVNRIMKPVDVRVLLDSIEGTPLSAPVYIAATLALREAEVAGLRWDDFSGTTLTVSNQRQTLYRRIVGGKQTEPTTDRRPKRSKVRRFSVPTLVIAEIQRRAGTQEGYVCLKDGKPWRAQTLSRWWAAHAESIGLGEWTFHHLRHLAVGSLRAIGADYRLIAQIAGHTNISQTLEYMDVTDDEPAKAIGKVDKRRRKPQDKP